MNYRTLSSGVGVMVGLGLMVGLTGCGGSGGSKATLSGTVKLGGQALPGGEVHLVGDDKSSTTALIAPDGKYFFPTPTLGAVKLSVAGPSKPSDPKAAAPTVVVPAKYGSPDTSGLTTTVKDGENKYDIELTP